MQCKQQSEQQVAAVMTERGRIAAAFLRIMLSMLIVQTACKSGHVHVGPPEVFLPFGDPCPHMTWFIGPTLFHNLNGISIGSAVFAGFTNVPNTRTHSPRNIGDLSQITTPHLSEKKLKMFLISNPM